MRSTRSSRSRFGLGGSVFGVGPVLVAYCVCVFFFFLRLVRSIVEQVPFSRRINGRFSSVLESKGLEMVAVYV